MPFKMQNMSCPNPPLHMHGTPFKMQIMWHICGCSWCCCSVLHVWGSCALNIMKRRIVVCTYAGAPRQGKSTYLCTAGGCWVKKQVACNGCVWCVFGGICEAGMRMGMGTKRELCLTPVLSLAPIATTHYNPPDNPTTVCMYLRLTIILLTTL